MSLVLLVEAAMIAVFTALDVFLFFMCWEVTMIPMYFMIILWGGPGRMAAGIKFVLYSLTGSLLLLVGMLGLYVQGGRTFDLAAALGAGLSVRRTDVDLRGVSDGVCHQAADDPVPLVAARRAFRGANGGQRHPRRRPVEDGRLRVPALRSADAAGSVRGVRAGHFMVLRRGHPLRRLSGPGPDRPEEADRVLLDLAHGIRDARNLQLQRPGHTRRGAADVQPRHHDRGALPRGRAAATTARTADRSATTAGCTRPMPRFAAFLCLFAVASFGLPGTSNFIGEFLVLVGTSYESFAKVLLAMGGIVLAAAYMLWMLQRVMLGPGPDSGHQPPARSQPAGDSRADAPGGPDLLIGLYPGPLMETMDSSVTALVGEMQQATRLARIP